MPGVAQAHASLPAITPEKPEMMHLCLPSIMPSSLWATGCLPGIVDKERRLRLAQADDALAELHRQLRIVATICDYKKSIGPSQKLGLRTRTLLNRFRDKTLRCARRYSAVFEALKALDPNGWMNIRLGFVDLKFSYLYYMLVDKRGAGENCWGRRHYSVRDDGWTQFIVATFEVELNNKII